jgi:ABC-type uncharacterized transport system fused permease/ATPase subunit
MLKSINVSALLLALYLSKEISKYSDVKLSYCKFLNNQNKSKLKTNIKPNFLKVCLFLKSLIGLKEAALISILSIVIIIKSALELKFIQLTTIIEKNIISATSDSFYTSLQNFAKYIIPSSIVFGLNHYLLNELNLNLRNNLSSRLLTKFILNKNYFKISNASLFMEKSIERKKTFENIQTEVNI